MKKIYLLLFLLSMLITMSVNAQSLTYGFAFDISNGGIARTPFSVANEEVSPGGVAFSSDGTKMFIVGGSSDAVQQYRLSNPFDVATGAILESSFGVLDQEAFATDISFNNDGTKMYVTGNFSDGVNQYTLDTPFDITDINQVTFDGLFELPGNASIQALGFSTDGTKMFLVNGFQDIDQYTLNTAFDVTGVVTDDIISFDTDPEGNNVTGLTFSPNGFKMFIIFDDGASLGTVINQYSLTNPFDISGGITFDQDFDIITEEADPKGLTFSADGTRMFVVGGASNSFAQEVNQYDLNVGGFSETAANDGTVEGSLLINVFGESFDNAGSTLTLTTDYNLIGLSNGLIPTIMVDASGSFATLTLSGSTADHQNINDVAEINLTFQNSAFAGGDVSVFDNVTNAGTGVGIDFQDNVQSITYGSAFDLSGGVTLTGNSGDLTTIARDASGLAFSDDGMTLFVLGGFNNQVIQYSLGSPFDVNSGLTLEGSPFSVANEEPGFSTGITFSADGMRMFVVGSSTRTIYQYSLMMPFNITSGVAFNGNSFSVNSQEASPQDIAFSTDGTRMFIVGSHGDEVNSYDLTTPFDITAGVTFDGIPFSILAEESEVTDFSFSADGTRMLIVGNVENEITQYNLAVPFDFTSEVAVEDNPFSVANEEMSPFAVSFSGSGDRMFIVGRDERAVFQYDLAIGGFTESTVNDGSVQGSVTINILGDKFTNRSGTLTPVTDFTINNLPAGLTPTLSVASDGFSAILVLNGKATNNQNLDDVSSLEFSFKNSAFEGDDAIEVTNATSASSNFSIDFRENNPRLSYGQFDLLNASFVGDPFSLTGQVGNPTGMALSDDGTKMLVLDGVTSEVKQFSLANPFDITSGVVIEGSPFSVFDQGGGITGATFNSDGTKLFVVGISFDRVSQYSLTVPYQITPDVMFGGSTNSLQGEDEAPQSVVFSTDGMKMFIAGAENGVINQYSLNTAFDIRDGVSFDDVAFSVANEEGFPTGTAFSSDGLNMFVVGTTNANVNQYLLTTPFDLTSGVIYLDTDFNIGTEESTPRDLVFSEDGSNLFVVGSGSFAINQYSLTGSLTETITNDGSVAGSTTIGMLDDTFTNVGSTLEFEVDYTIDNLPAGLTPMLFVAMDGYSATFSLEGIADSHANANDISSLQFTFENSAFTNSNAEDVANAVDSESNIGIDFIASEETDIVDFVLAEQTATAVINTTDHTVDIEVLSGTDLSSLTPTVTVSEGATISPNSNVQRDFSSDVSYTVTAENGIATQNWTVTVAEQQVAPTDIVLTNATAFENSAVGTSIGMLSSADQNMNDMHLYTLVSGIGSDDNDSFTIDGDQLQVAGALDFESDNTLSIRIMTDDQNGGVFEKTFEIAVNNINETPASASLSDDEREEGLAAGSIFATISVNDPDEDDTHIFALVLGEGDIDNALFDIDGSNLINLEELDFEQIKSAI